MKNKYILWSLFDLAINSSVNIKLQITSDINIQVFLFFAKINLIFDGVKLSDPCLYLYGIWYNTWCLR